MPKVIAHTPAWLSPPSSGSNIFDPTPKRRSPDSPARRAAQSPTPTEYAGPTRLLAHRGTEVFTAVGNELRWADLTTVKQDWEETSHSPRRTTKDQDNDKSKQMYRVLKVSVHDPIRQLVLSPSGAFLAICSEHTIRIAVLPDSSRLSQDLQTPINIKTFQLGPTTHAKPEAALASVLWHPLAVSTLSSDCLVTVTSNAAVRVWEIDRTNLWSFERPALAIDLRKLADGVSCDQDFQPSKFGTSRGFSVDDIDMEVASSSFGGQGQDNEDAWASMTLWTAMKNGDVYALCPLLPSQWSPTPTTIPSLSTSAVSRIATTTENADPDERRAADQQYEWVQQIDEDEPVGDSEEVEVRYRPENPSAIPRLQGPYSLEFEDDALDIEVTDLVVFPAHLDENDIYSGEEDYETSSTGLPFSTLILATSDSKVHVTLEVEGVSGQWLPKRGRSTFSVPTCEGLELALVETVKLDDHNTANAAFLSFSPDPMHEYSVFVTDGVSAWAVSLEDWATRVTEETSGDAEIGAGLRTRLASACSTQISMVDQILSMKEEGQLSAPVILDDPEFGYFLLTASTSKPYGATIDQPGLRMSTQGQSSADFARSQSLGRQLQFETAEVSAADPIATRPIYAPPRVLYQHPEQPINQMLQKLQLKQKSALKEQPMRLSPAMLDIMTSSHRSISRQTAELESAAAEIFRRCERLREELGDQFRQMTELADRLQRLQSGDEDDYTMEKQAKKTPDDRLHAIKERQTALVKRYEALRMKVGRAGMTKKELSAKETAWMAEIEALNNNVGYKADESNATSAEGTLMERYQDVSSPPSTVVSFANVHDRSAPSRISSLTNLDASKHNKKTCQSLLPPGHQAWSEVILHRHAVLWRVDLWLVHVINARRLQRSWRVLSERVPSSMLSWGDWRSCRSDQISLSFWI